MSSFFEDVKKGVYGRVKTPFVKKRVEYKKRPEKKKIIKEHVREEASLVSLGVRARTGKGHDEVYYEEDR